MLGLERSLGTRLVTYADDLVILCRRGNAEAALHRTSRSAEHPFVSRFYPSDETVEIFIEADFETLPEERRRLALLNIPRHLSSEATAAVARHAANPILHLWRAEKFRHPGGTWHLPLPEKEVRPVSLSRWSGIHVGLAGSIYRGCRADDDFVHCCWLARHSRRGRLGYDGGNP